ncbi:MAG: hypothetical protein ACKVOA_05520, partial [Methylophilaceae bacterium]
MQNLPTLVTQSPLVQNSTLKNIVASQDNQKSSETNTSFKEVLSKQVENDVPKKAETKQSKTPQAKSTQNQAQPSSKPPQAKSAEHKDEVETSDADQVDALDTSLLSDDLNPKAVKNDSKVEDTDEVLAAKLQDAPSQYAQLPISIAHIPFAANVKSDAPEGDSQKRLQLDANLRIALGQSTKSTLVTDNANVLSDKSSDSSTQSEMSSDKKWLDSMLPNMHKSLENKDQLAGKLGTKIVSEAGIPLTDNFSTK